MGILARRSRRTRARLAFTAALVCVALDLTAAPGSAEEVATFEATYEVRQSGLQVGVMRRSVRAESPERYVYESVSHATGPVALFVRERVVERSVWTLEDGRPRPLHYLYESQGGDEDHKRVSIEFDWGAGEATNEAEGQRWSMPVGEQVQDKLLYQLALLYDLRRAAADLDYQVADGGHLKDYHFTRLGEEVIDSPLGRYRTVKVEHLRTDKHRRTTLWCSPELGYLPVRVDQERGGTLRTAWLTRLEPAPAGTGASTAP